MTFLITTAQYVLWIGLVASCAFSGMVLLMLLWDWVIQHRRAMQSSRWTEEYLMGEPKGQTKPDFFVWFDGQCELRRESYKVGGHVSPECIDSIELLADSLTRKGRYLLR